MYLYFHNSGLNTLSSMDKQGIKGTFSVTGKNNLLEFIIDAYNRLRPPTTYCFLKSRKLIGSFKTLEQLEI